MMIETLGESLQRAVSESFAMPSYKTLMLQGEASKMNKLALDTSLAAAKDSKQTGLKANLVAAFASGDATQIHETMRLAQQATTRGMCIKAMRHAVTIENKVRKNRR